MLAIPKCMCFQGPAALSPGQGLTDTVARQLMSQVANLIIDSPICPEAVPYFLVTLAASIFLIPGVLHASDKGLEKLDTEEMKRLALELHAQLPDIIALRCAWVDQDNGETRQ